MSKATDEAIYLKWLRSVETDPDRATHKWKTWRTRAMLDAPSEQEAAAFRSRFVENN